MTAVTTATAVTAETGVTAETSVTATGSGSGRAPRRSPAAWRRRRRSDAGMTTAEYAVGTLGACALAAGLYKVVTSATFTAALTEVLERALHAT
ncbi:DUF4244 domain-containing protein [Kitasatospora sp. NPDC048538]|uniref:DUF4244 domain-containing protein n=1 Tax=unclassified Kitasatospora TaxID=2633591 RepID=UPI0033CF6179